MKETRRRFIVLFCLVSLAHGAFLAAAAPLFRRGAGSKAPGLVVSLALPARPGPAANKAAARQTRPAPSVTEKVLPRPPAEITHQVKPPWPQVRPKPRPAPQATRPRPVVKKTVRRIRRRVRPRARPRARRPQKTRTRPARAWRVAATGRPPTVRSGSPAPPGQMRTAHLGPARRPGLLEPDVRAVCLNRHLFQRHYPEWARQRGWQGRVILKVLVTKDGRVGRVETVRRSAHDLLNRTAVRVARSLRFRPARKDGRPIQCWVRVPVKYVIVDQD
ncbi:MAG: TonB family protein [Proteobacteria bacterium]|nr:TonB family protein [Pseudomonadota bacterium]MBU1742067.1 TonB family protein [Pseudomonadota bacterium]